MPFGQTKSKAMLLTFMVVVVFFSGFIGVYFVQAAWERSVPETVLTSDSTLSPFFQEIAPFESGQYLKNWTSGTSFNAKYGAQRNQTELTPYYDGNNTWVISVPQLDPFPTGDLHDTQGLAVIYFMFKLPNADTYLINDVYCEVNFTETVSMKGKLVIAGGFDPAVAAADRDDDHYAKLLYSDDPVAHTSIDDYTFDFNLALNDAIDYYQNVKNDREDAYMYFEFYQSSHVGWDAHAIELQFHVNGTYVETSNKADMMAYALIGGASLCMVMGIFMTDTVDLDDFIKRLRG